MRNEWEEAAWSVDERYLSDWHWDDKVEHQCVDANCHRCNASHEARRDKLAGRLRPSGKISPWLDRNRK